jgi:hypothetical protein
VRRRAVVKADRSKTRFATTAGLMHCNMSGSRKSAMVNRLYLLVRSVRPIITASGGSTSMRLLFVLIIAAAFALPIAAQAGVGGKGGGGGESKTSVSPTAATVVGHPCTSGGCTSKAPTGGQPCTSGACTGKAPTGGHPCTSGACTGKAPTGGHPCTSGACAGKRTGFGPAGAAHKSTGSDAAKTQ